MTRRTLADWQKLELERFDTSYRRTRAELPPPARHKCKERIVERIVEVVTVPDSAKKLFYHAGRFAGGARDRKACDSYRALQRAGEL